MLSGTFHDRGGGANDPDLSVAITRSMATSRTTEILYIIVEIPIPLRVFLFPVFHCDYVLLLMPRKKFKWMYGRVFYSAMNQY